MPECLSVMFLCRTILCVRVVWSKNDTGESPRLGNWEKIAEGESIQRDNSLVQRRFKERLPHLQHVSTGLERWLHPLELLLQLAPDEQQTEDDSGLTLYIPQCIMKRLLNPCCVCAKLPR